MAVNFKDTVDLGGNRIEALADPTADQHAATRKYVLDQIAGIGATYTDEQARDALAAALTAGGNIDITVDDTGNTITISVEALTTADLSDFSTATDSAIDTRVTAAFVNALSGVDADTLGGDSKATILAAAAAAALDTEEVQDIIGAAITAGNNIDVTYDDAGTGTVTIAVESLTVGDITSVPTQNLLGRGTTGTGVAEHITVGGGIEFVSGATQIRLAAFTGDVTKNAGATATTIANDAVTNAKLANAPANTFKGNNTGSAADPVDMTPAQAKALLAIASTDVSDFATAADARVSAVVTSGFVNALTGVDADTLGGSTKAQVVSDAIAGVVDTAPATLDTLNELAAALGDDPNFATTISNALALRVQSYATNIGDGAATTYTITHNLNTRDVIVQIYENGDDYDQVWATVKRATVNTVTVTFGTAPSASQYRVVVQGRA